ncbi:MAG: hypothetical protein M0P73_12775 [Syntrophobacterales bacterium]|jgi:hypothetical protein|nr:hypothetical protein [Syntrophobacterales bacterium]
MDKAMFPHQIMGLVNSITTPLLSSLILIDDLISEQSDNIEDYGKILLIDEQVQSSIEYFLELRTLALNKIGSGLIDEKNNGRKNTSKQCRERHSLRLLQDLRSESIYEKADNEKNRKAWWREFSIGILIVMNIGIMVWQLR